MNHPRRSPADLGLQLWDLVKDTGEDGMPHTTALQHMSPHQFQVAKVWDRDEMCPIAGECFLYALGRYFVTTDPRLSVLALARELGLFHHKAVRLHGSTIEPLPDTERTTAQLQVVHAALSDVINATAPLRKAGLSVDLAARLHTPNT
ncbi:hypothetical protein [Streptomyces poonensis]|uniref:Uncharacterized protein n=1 Tax=Streptomyces poonensis TaxID=68255 RepID=A0A918QHA4_9ACTN|nr:hypothetical protein [Streptomyces poonensis]GGZ44332.1 hypothetical protein GCM10010365_75960 [Streptomyces poonensis]